MDIRLTPNGNDLCYETYYGVYFRSSYAAILETMYNMNGKMVFQGEVTMNDVYKSLGLELTNDKNCVGWNDDYCSFALEKPPWIDFYTSTGIAPNGEPCINLNYMYGPIFLGEWHDFMAEKFGPNN